jgi:hypothetical protein
MIRVEFNLQTGERNEVTLTPEEESSALAQSVAWEAENTIDKRAERFIDGIDRLQFEHLFNLENRTRVLEARSQITKAQYRDMLIVKWKELNPAP